jgi:hypothetical protein
MLHYIKIFMFKNKSKLSLFQQMIKLTNILF